MRNSLTLLLLFLLIFNGVNAQFVAKYRSYTNGKQNENEFRELIRQDSVAAILFISGEDSTFQYLDFRDSSTLRVSTFDGIEYGVETPFSELQRGEKVPCQDSVAGFKCDKVELSINSNRIEVWYTHQAPLKGSPSLSLLPDSGLVVKYAINGSREVILESIEKLDLNDRKFHDFSQVIETAKRIDQPQFSRLEIESRFTVIPIFDHQQINFSSEDFEQPVEEVGTTFRYSKGTVILKQVDLKQVNPGDYIFAKLTEWSNGDAYDRTGSVFMFPERKKLQMLDALKRGIEVLPTFVGNDSSVYQGIISDKQYDVPVELMRFFTPFGVGGFNDRIVIDGYAWADSSVYKQEISSLFTAADSLVWLGVFIGNYDGGGHRVSLDLEVYPGEGEQRGSNFRQPLFNTVNIMEMSGQSYGKLFLYDTLRVEFELPEAVENLRLVFTTTGHGGWGSGDEFVPKLNTISVDGDVVFNMTPWRSDCATYRMLNPASGNFSNGLSSSDLSRSNWCPGTVTTPYFIPLPGLKSGKHTLELIIPQGEPEGNSLSYWSVSGTLIGD